MRLRGRTLEDGYGAPPSGAFKATACARQNKVAWTQAALEALTAIGERQKGRGCHVMPLGPLIFWGSFLIVLVLAIVGFLGYVFHRDI